MKYIRIMACILCASTLFVSGCATLPTNTPIAVDFKNSMGIEFMKIPPGEFEMGLSPNDAYLGTISKMGKTPKHHVKLTKGFYIQNTEVTQAQWKAVMGDTPSSFGDCDGDCPVETVSWDDVQKFIEKLNSIEGTDKYRLPTEAEWEFACRAGTDTNFYFGNCLSYKKANFFGDLQITGCDEGSYNRATSTRVRGSSVKPCKDCLNRFTTVPVKTFPPNNYGLYEMHGNVAEWCQDSFSKRSDKTQSVVDPLETKDTSLRVTRGGSWGNHVRVLLSGYCAFAYQASRNHLTGFRLVRDI